MSDPTATFSTRTTTQHPASTRRGAVCNPRFRARAPRRDFHGLDADASQERVEGHGELPGSVADQEPEVRGAIAEIIKRLRICCVVHGPSGFAVTPRICTYREPTSITNRQYRRWRVTAQSTWKKSVPSIVAA
jgi:hypothetical protein